mmetsp:Transcript_1368/g.1841  ORF Transcript_1368/g.1841 Transcript_1368/m.1841 type:complete len:184 (-) Transcript_1368:122-673(-)|eukprot:CAMPEP_0198145396 /NCGR_PEP_ID=MMETSP1443-20131203/23142_1 /TAXON_ID=186043 /ORGANISM="Entomoneis sp., Strain CCMP2396" /LENGTH=183 /DNA_ID=CAMNT_0043809031 /DNA_START=154 /DNA_END=705 /DNA_ORIENTATION=-
MPPSYGFTGGGWSFQKDVDYYGNDLRGPTFPASLDYTNLDHIREIAREAEEYEAVCFNTIGCIKKNCKGSRASVEGWTDEVPRLRGTFIRSDSVPAGWLYLTDVDSPGHDLLQVQSDRNRKPRSPGMSLYFVAEVLEVADDHGAVAFNLQGWVKNSLVPHDQLTGAWTGSYDRVSGLYVRIED